MSRKRLLPTFALLAALSLVAAACGQKSGVSNLASVGTDSAVEGEEGAIGSVTESGEVIIGYDAEGNAITAAADSAAAKAVTGGGTTTRSGTKAGATTTTTARAGGSPTKVWGNKIVIGIHAPITGAAPLPSSFQAAAEFVKEYYNKQGGVHGRQIDIVIKDDQYQPAIATQRCQEMVKADGAFLLIGAAGTDQIQSCARYAAGAGVPYLSAGVTEKGLRTLKNYFAISMSYKEQGPYLAKFMKETFPALTTVPGEVAMVYSDTPNFLDAVQGFTAAFPGVRTMKIPRTPNGGDLGNAARDLCTAADGTAVTKIAFPLMAPSAWIQLLGQQPQTCTIQWAGIGVTMGINEVAKSACNLVKAQFDGSTFFSPFPGEDKVYVDTGSLDPQLYAAAKASGKTYDDIWIALWGTTKGIIEILRQVGPDLTRAKFVTTTENASLTTGLGPPLNYTPTDHFGADQVHILKANCAKSKYDTIATFKKF